MNAQFAKFAQNIERGTIKVMIIILFAGVFFAIFGLVCVMIGIAVYNSLVALRNQVDRSWANIDVILKQRHDEIPQLIQIVEQFTLHEKVTLQKIMEARDRYSSASDTAAMVNASNEVTNGLKGIFAIGEAYPELKSSAQFMQLQSRLSLLEDSLADRRENFNNTVTNFNTRIAQVPDTFFAKALGYAHLALLQITDAEKTMPSLRIDTAA